MLLIEKGFKKIISNVTNIDKGKEIVFKLQLQGIIEEPYQVYWQVTNNGHEANTVNCLRGDWFEDEKPFTGNIMKHKEDTQYRGTHIVQAIIVQDGTLVAKSKDFIVKIK